jgi:hypothetical protein
MVTAAPDAPDPKLDQTAKHAKAQLDGGHLQQAETEIHKAYLDYRAGNGTDASFWASMTQGGLTPQDMKYLSLGYAHDNWKGIASGQSDGMDGNPSQGWINQGALDFHSANLKGSDAEADFERHFDALLKGEVNSDPAFHSRFFDNYMRPQDLDQRIAALDSGHPVTDVPPPPGQASAADAYRGRDSRTLMNLYEGLSPEARAKLFPPEGMTQKSVQDTLADPNSKLSAADKFLLKQLNDHWPDWATKDGAAQPIKLDDVVRAAGATNGDGSPKSTNDFTTDGKPDSPLDPAKVQAEIAQKNAQAADFLNALGANLTSQDGLLKNGSFTVGDIQDRLKQVPNDDAHKAERDALQQMITNFAQISSDGQKITAEDIANYARKHGLQFNSKDNKWEAKTDDKQPGQAPENTKLTDDQKKAIDAKVDAIDKLPDRVKLVPGQPIYKTITDAYLARAKVTGEPTDVQHQRAYFLKVMKDSGFQISDQLAAKFMKDGSPSHLPAAWNSQLTTHTEFKLFGDGEKDKMRQAIAENGAGSITDHLNLPDVQKQQVAGMVGQMIRDGKAKDEASALAQLVKDGVLTQAQVDKAIAEQQALRAAILKEIQDYEARKNTPPAQVT